MELDSERVLGESTNPLLIQNHIKKRIKIRIRKTHKSRWEEDGKTEA